MIELDSRQLALITTILKRHLSNCEVYAFGSRVHGGARKFSGLDLVLKSEQAIEWRTMDALKDDFSFSDLPILVDLLDWNILSEDFLAAIEADLYSIPM